MSVSLGLPAAVAVAVVLAAAAIPKAMNRDAFQLTVRDFGLVPKVLVPTVAVALPYIEILVAALILVPTTRRGGAMAAVVLLGVFLVVTIVAIRKRPGVPCGCFGVGRSTPVSWASVARNICLVLLAALAAGSDASPVTSFPAVATGCGAALLVLLVDRAVGTFRGRWVRGDIVRG